MQVGLQNVNAIFSRVWLPWLPRGFLLRYGYALIYLKMKCYLPPPLSPVAVLAREVIISSMQDLT